MVFDQRLLQLNVVHIRGQPWVVCCFLCTLTIYQSTPCLMLTYLQGWENPIVIDTRLRYSLLFVYRMHWSLYFFE